MGQSAKQVVAEFIKEARLRADLTQQDVATALGCTVPAVSHIESGRRDIKISTLFAVAKALKMEARDLLPRKFAA